jgi:hypothetical protein
MVGVAAVAAGLGGCSDIRSLAGVDKKAPDEFAVLRRAPLTVPPNFNLRPPRPGERAVPQIDPSRQAQVAIFGRESDQLPLRSQGGSAGEEALLQTLRIERVDPDIRQKVDRESALLAVDQRNFVERLMFWRTPPPPGVAVDALEERRRLQENDALGRPPIEGETPTIERKDTVRNNLF